MSHAIVLTVIFIKTTRMRFARRKMIATIAAVSVVAAVFAWWWTTTRREKLVGSGRASPTIKKWVWKGNGQVTTIPTNQLAFDRLKSHRELSSRVHPAPCRDPAWFDPNPSKYDLNVLEFMVDQGARMMQHLVAHPKYRNYEYTKAIQQNWNGSVFSSLQRTGGAVPGNKCIGIQLDYDPVDVPLEMSAPRLNTRLLHEMAHVAAPMGGHREPFAKANRWLVKVATEELGWRVALKCAACRRSGICRNDCPKCEWWEDPKTCLPYEPGP